MKRNDKDLILEKLERKKIKSNKSRKEIDKYYDSFEDEDVEINSHIMSKLKDFRNRSY